MPPLELFDHFLGWAAFSGAASTLTLGRLQTSSASSATPPSSRSRTRNSSTTLSVRSQTSLGTPPSLGTGGRPGQIGVGRDVGTGPRASPRCLTLCGRAGSRMVDWMKTVCSSKLILERLTWPRMTLVIHMDTIFVR